MRRKERKAHRRGVPIAPTSSPRPRGPGELVEETEYRAGITLAGIDLLGVGVGVQVRRGGLIDDDDSRPSAHVPALKPRRG